MGRTPLTAAARISRAASSAPIKPVPWRWRLEQRSLIIALPEAYRVLSWAPLNGGARRASSIVNHQIARDDRAAVEHASAYLKTVVRHLGFDPASTVAMMTGAAVARMAHVSARRGDLIAAAWCTAGCSNALRIGDPSSVRNPRLAGTINLVLAVNQPLTACAMAEAIAMAAEARAAAVLDAGVASTRSGLPATGTGTDCIVVAAPIGTPAHDYCGKHTVVGELIGKAANRSCARALRRRSA